jgi:2-polyprenyl-6-methoxyphenol hydroxylase-like FAD-dependent oxidoreductase
VRAMSVLIVGGGIGGLCLATALTQRGIACEIVEREPVWTTVGAGISFYPNGVRALRCLGLDETVVSAGAAIYSVRTCDRAGKVVNEFPGENWEGIGREPFDDASLDRFADFGGPTPLAIEMLRADPNLHFGPAEEIERDEWRAGRALLIGDAAHACSPTMAQGGSLAIEDAIVLAELLMEEP